MTATGTFICRLREAVEAGLHHVALHADRNDDVEECDTIVCAHSLLERMGVAVTMDNEALYDICRFGH